MVSQRPDEIRRTLADRVARRVQGHGISRASVDAAVTTVLAALQTSSTAAAAPGVPARGTFVIAAFSARSVPDLASRVRGALAREGVTPDTLGSAMAGNHNVVTARIPDSARASSERAASALGASISFVSEESTA